MKSVYLILDHQKPNKHLENFILPSIHHQLDDSQGLLFAKINTKIKVINEKLCLSIKKLWEIVLYLISSWCDKQFAW